MFCQVANFALKVALCVAVAGAVAGQGSSSSGSSDAGTPAPPVGPPASSYPAEGLAGGAFCPCAAGLTAARCTPATLRIHPDDGSVAASLFPAAPVDALSGAPLRRLVLELVPSSANTTADGTFAFVADGLGPATVTAVEAHNAVLEASAATAWDGMVAVDATVRRTAAPAQLRLNVSTAAGLWFLTPMVTVLPSGDAGVVLAFAPSSFFTPRRPAAAVALQAPLPAVVLVVQDRGGAAVTALDKASVTAVGRYVGQVQANATLSMAAATVQGSTVRLTDLRLGPSTILNAQVTVVFSVGPVSLVSPPFRVTAVATPAARLQFPVVGGICTAGTSRLAVMPGAPLPPLTVEVTDSGGVVDTTTAGLSVTAHSVHGTLSGATAEVFAGTAVFPSLAFASRHTELGSTAAQIEFRLSAPSAPSAAPLLSPPVVLHATAGTTTSLRFLPDSFIQTEGHAPALARGQPVPAVRLELVDAAWNRVPDSVASVVAAASGRGVVGALSATAALGVATFAGLTAADTGDATRVVFAVAGASIGSGDMTLLPVPATAVSLAFEHGPHVLALGAALTVPTGEALPPIIVRLLDADGSLAPSSVSGVVIEMTTPGLAAAPATAAVHSGRAVFPAPSVAAPGRGHFVFRAVASQPWPAVRTTLSSGVVAAVARVVPAAVLRFHPMSHVRYAAEPLRVHAGAPAPAIGVAVASTAGALANVAVNVTAAVSNAVLSGRTTVETTDGVAWFDQLSVAALPGAAGDVRLTFTAAADPPATRPAVAGQAISTGAVTFVSAATPLAVAVEPLLGSGIALGRRDVTGTLPYDATTRFSLRTGCVGTSGAAMAAPGGAVTLSTAWPVDPGSVAVPGGALVDIPALAIAGEPVIRGFLSMLRLSSEGVPPRVVGPFANNVSDADDSVPVLVAEVATPPTAFSQERWLQRLRALMNLERDRVRVVRVTVGATASSEHDVTWRGTRVELQLLPPTAASAKPVSAADLAEVFLSLGDGCNGLSLHRTYPLAAESTCDLHRLDRQIAAAKRCIAVSPPEDRCRCHVPLFDLLGARCDDTAALKTVCSKLSTCPSGTIKDGCAAFRRELYLMYVYIVAGSVLGAALLVVGYGFYVGFFQRLWGRVRLRKSGEETGVSLKAEQPAVIEYADVL